MELETEIVMNIILNVNNYRLFGRYKFFLTTIFLLSMYGVAYALDTSMPMESRQYSEPMQPMGVEELSGSNGDQDNCVLECKSPVENSSPTYPGLLDGLVEKEMQFLIRDIPPGEIKNMSYSWLSTLSENQISFMSREQILAMDANQVEVLSSVQVQAMTPSQVIAALQVSSFRPNQLINFFKKLSASQVDLFVVSLSPGSIQYIPKEIIPLIKISIMKPEQIKGLSNQQIKYLTLIQINSLSAIQIGEILGNLTSDNLAMLHKSLTPMQIQEISLGYNDNQLNKLYRNLTRPQIYGLMEIYGQSNTQSLINKITDTQLISIINGLNKEKIALVSRERLERLPNRVVKGLKDDQLLYYQEVLGNRFDRTTVK